MGQKRKNNNNSNNTTNNNTSSQQNENRSTQQQQGTREESQRQFPAGQGGAKLEAKLEELQSEWTVERIKEVAAAALVLVGVFITAKKRRKIEEAGEKIASVLGVKSLRDWTPPEGLLGMLGIRKQEDVDKEVEKLYTRLA